MTDNSEWRDRLKESMDRMAEEAIRAQLLSLGYTEKEIERSERLTKELHTANSQSTPLHPPSKPNLRRIK